MMTKKIKIAEIIGKWVGGGVEQVVYNYCSRLDKNRFEIDFLIDEDSVFIPRKELEKVGINVKIIPPYQKVIKYQRELTKLCEEEKYDIVHSHLNALSIFPLRAAKKAGIKVRIAHSHSTTNKKEKKKNILKQILKPFSKVYATDYFCCTEHAGRWLFGNKAFDNGNVYVMNNAIEVEKFKFDEDVRQLKRKELEIDENALVIGHCGRFVEQKNHRFLIDVFNEVHKKRKDAVLVLVGQGPLKEEMEERVSNLGLKNSVKFLGQRDDINKLYSMFDLFLFPSLYEGLGMVVIEAQVAGCRCIVSENVPNDVKLTNMIYFTNLIEMNKWIENSIVYSKYDRTKICLDGIEREYDILKQVKKLENKYIDLEVVYESCKDDLVI